MKKSLIETTFAFQHFVCVYMACFKRYPKIRKFAYSFAHVMFRNTLKGERMDEKVSSHLALAF